MTLSLGIIILLKTAQEDVGANVSQGDRIALSGDTGDSSEPHSF